MHYERAPRFRRSKLEGAPPPLRYAEGFAPLRRRSFDGRAKPSPLTTEQTRSCPASHDHFGHIFAVTGVRCRRDGNALISGSMENRKLSDRTAAHSLSRIQLGKRRSTRVALHSSVGLAGEDRHKASFTMPAKATNLNKYGAAVQLNRDLQIGSVVAVKNNRGIQVSARVVSQLLARNGVPTYAIEFVEQDENAREFWGIAFPSAN